MKIQTEINQKKLNKLEFDSFTTTLGEDGIIYCIVTKPSDCTLVQAKKVLDSIKTLSQGTPVLVLRDISLLRSSSREARSYLGGEEYSRLIKALALVAQSSTSRIIAAFYTGLNQPLIPIKIFSNKQEALDWLHTFL